MYSIKEFISEPIIKHHEVLSDWSQVISLLNTNQTVTADLEMLYKPLNMAIMQRQGNNLIYPIQIERTCDILDCIEGINCDISLEMNGLIIPISDKTIVPMAALQYTDVLIKASIPLDALPESFGFRARCTVLDSISRIRLANITMKLDCGGDYCAFQGMAGVACP